MFYQSFTLYYNLYLVYAVLILIIIMMCMVKIINSVMIDKCNLPIIR